MSTSTNRCSVQGKRKTNKLIGTVEEFTIKNSRWSRAQPLAKRVLISSGFCPFLDILLTRKKKEISKVQFSLEFKAETQSKLLCGTIQKKQLTCFCTQTIDADYTLAEQNS